MDNTEKEKHPFMISGGQATRLATYEELQQVQNSLKDIEDTMVMMSKAITELSKCLKELTINFVDTTKSTQKDIDKLKGDNLQIRNFLHKEWVVCEEVKGK